MKSLTEYLVFNIEQRREFINITSEVEALVRKSGVKEGLCLVNAMHITADSIPQGLKFPGEKLIACCA